MSPLWAGTVTGIMHAQPCGVDEVCSDAPGYPDCYADPLTPCPTVDSTCAGDVVLSCYGYPYQKRIDCAAQGQVCRVDCDIGLGYTMAGCHDPLPVGATACDATSFVPVCEGGSAIERCDTCFQQGGTCACYATTEACADCEMDPTVPCQCADILSWEGAASAQCIDASYQLCDAASAAESCQGEKARRCLGFVLDTDCAAYGATCALVAGRSGCVASPAQSCDASLGSSCSGSKVTGCCPASAVFPVAQGTRMIPCPPGSVVTIDCATLSSAYQTFVCQAMMGDCLAM
jgi:hypothetical protein